MKQVVVAVVLLFLRIYQSAAEEATTGLSTNLHCPLNLISYAWYRTINGEHIVLTDYNRYNGLSTKTLTIRTVQVGDAGYYFCEGYAVDGDVTSASWISLTVIDNGIWSTWTQWNGCSVTCGTGHQQRSRECTTGSCTGAASESYQCIRTPCPVVNGVWSHWNPWEYCSVSCGTGVQRRKRFCNNPFPQNGGDDCLGNEYEEKSCTVFACPGVPTVAVQQPTYSVSTGSSLTLVCTVTSTLTVNDVYWQRNVGGSITQIRSATNTNKYSGSTTSTPSLTIFNADQSDAGVYTCFATNSVGTGQSTTTTLFVTGIDGGWSQWNSWETCTVTCGTGVQIRTRLCNNPSPQNSGANCPGNGYDQRSCTLSPCSVDGGWSHWNPWESCTVTCGNGEQRRKRFCNNPVRQNNGADCEGNDYEERSCSLSICPVDGRWSSWNPWEVCNVTCGTGQQGRSRSCNNPIPLNGGSNCTGEIHEDQLCTVSQCEEANAAGSVAPIAGGVGGGIVVFVCIVVIIVVYIRKSKRRKPADDRVSEENQGLQFADTPVSLRQGHQDGMYINIGRTSRQSSSDTDDFIPSKAPTRENDLDEGTTYQNLPDILTTVKIEDLKEYIKLKDSNEGLQSEYKTIPYGPQHPTTTAQRKENVLKNRFKTTFPYDHTRVTLQVTPGSSNTDYINANFVDGFEKENCYIASQGPLKHTFHDFWTMIWQNNTRTIIMLTNLIEGTKEKCGKYWPEGGKPMVLGHFILTLQSEKERAAYVTREISVEDKKTKQKRNVIQYHFTAWPDHGTPDPLYLVLFHKRVISDQSDAQNGKLLVHCSAGIGRTGTYIGLDALYKEGRVTGCVDIVKFVKKMRYSRMNMVQTPDQYVCLHFALLEAFTMKDTNIGKEEFGTIWREIQSDKQPINHRKLYKEFKMLEAKKSEHKKSEFTSALSTENVQKNRNKSVIPSDNNRLFLTSYEKGRTDYINAIQAPSYTKFVGYLTTQLPLPETKIDFWTMVRDHSSSTIVIFINEQTEAELVYATTDDTFSCGSFTMKITRREKEEFNILSCTVVMSRKDEKAREVVIYCAVCSGYPKPGVLCKLVNMISTRVSMSHDAVTVVSGDGAKNCGLFCTFANAVSSMTIDYNADIFQLARLLQLRRPEFFADFDEYRLCYEALNFYLESTNVYANF